MAFPGIVVCEPYQSSKQSDTPWSCEREKAVGRWKSLLLQQVRVPCSRGPRGLLVTMPTPPDRFQELGNKAAEGVKPGCAELAGVSA